MSPGETCDLQIQYKVNLKRGKHWNTRSKKQLLLFQFHLSVQTDRSHSNLLLIYISLQITLVNVVVIKVEYSCQNLAFTILYFIDIYAFIHWSIAVFPKLYKLQTKKTEFFPVNHKIVLQTIIDNIWPKNANLNQILNCLGCKKIPRTNLRNLVDQFLENTDLLNLDSPPTN